MATAKAIVKAMTKTMKIKGKGRIASIEKAAKSLVKFVKNGPVKIKGVAAKKPAKKTSKK